MENVNAESRERCMDTVHAISSGKVSEIGLEEIAQLPHGPSGEWFCTALNGFLLKLEGDPILSMLEHEDEKFANLFKPIQDGEISEHLKSKVKHENMNN